MTTKPFVPIAIEDIAYFVEQRCCGCQWRYHDCGILERVLGSPMPEWDVDEDCDPVCTEYKRREVEA